MLFKTTDEVKKYVSLSINTEFDSLKPYVQQAEDKFMKMALGPAQYDDLLEKYDAVTEEDPLGDDDQALLDKVQLSLIHLALYLYTPILCVNISEKGIQINSTATSKQAFEWQVDKVEKYFLNTGFDALEALLAFLEENAETYTIWAGSGACTLNREFFINSATDFSLFYNIRDSRRLFMALRYIMRRIERFKLKPLLGADFYEELKTQIKENALTDENKEALDFIKYAVAHYAIAHGIVELSLEISENGTLLFATSDQITMNVKSSADENRLNNMSKKALSDAETFLQELKDHLTKNISDYPLFEESEAYIAADDTNTVTDAAANNTGNGVAFF